VEANELDEVDGEMVEDRDCSELFVTYNSEED
jgi:hypothetical protein